MYRCNVKYSISRVPQITQSLQGRCTMSQICRRKPSRKLQKSFEWAFESGQWWTVTTGVREVVPSPWSGYSEGAVTQCWPSCSRHHQVGWCDWLQTTPWFHARHRTDCLLKVAWCWSGQTKAKSNSSGGSSSGCGGNSSSSYCCSSSNNSTRY